MGAGSSHQGRRHQGAGRDHPCARRDGPKGRITLCVVVGVLSPDEKRAACAIQVLRMLLKSAHFMRR